MLEIVGVCCGIQASDLPVDSSRAAARNTCNAVVFFQIDA